MSSKEFGFCIVAKESFDKTRLVNFLDEVRIYSNLLTNRPICSEKTTVIH